MKFQTMTIKEIAAFIGERQYLTAGEISALESDQRSGVAVLIERYQLRYRAKLKEEARLQKMLVEEKLLWNQGYTMVAGVDEAGRGPLAGPVVAGAVIFNKGTTIAGLNDSKQLSSKKREELFEIIIQEAKAYGIGSASRLEIDSLNIHAASLLAMVRALERLNCSPDFVIVDGFQIKSLPYPQKALAGGDSLSMSIAAASILAKVARDRIMHELHQNYPCYGFNRNMGYGTLDHRQALVKHGPCSEHRRSFKLSE